MQGARQQLEQSLVVGEAPGSHATDVQLAEHRFRLGQVYWRMKGRYRSDKQFAYKQVCAGVGVVTGKRVGG